MEQRIIGFENGVAVVEKVDKFTVSKEDCEKQKENLANRKTAALKMIEDANAELAKIQTEEVELAEAEKIITEAELKFNTQQETPEAETLVKTPELPVAEQVSFDGGY